MNLVWFKNVLRTTNTWGQWQAGSSELSCQPATAENDRQIDLMKKYELLVFSLYNPTI